MTKIDYDTTSVEQMLTHAADHLRKAPKFAREAITEEVEKATPHILKDMELSSSRPQLPFIWSQDPEANGRAQRFYFATKVPNEYRSGKVRGRYSRTGAMEKATRVITVMSDSGSTTTLSNATPGAEFAIGHRQVPSHRQNKQPRIEEVGNKWRPILAERVGEAWIRKADPFGDYDNE